MVTTYYLEMTSKSDFCAKSLPEKVQLQEIKHKQSSFNKALYQMVGEPWQWTDKLELSAERWHSYVNRESLRTWVAYSDGAIVGYFELEKQTVDVEIKYFGLTKEFIGQGLGSGLLGLAINNAWAWASTKRVWVHTCSLDHPNALNNYLRCGFRIFKTEQN